MSEGGVWGVDVYFYAETPTKKFHDAANKCFKPLQSELRNFLSSKGFCRGFNSFHRSGTKMVRSFELVFGMWLSTIVSLVALWVHAVMFSKPAWSTLYYLSLPVLFVICFQSFGQPLFLFTKTPSGLFDPAIALLAFLALRATRTAQARIELWLKRMFWGFTVFSCWEAPYMTLAFAPGSYKFRQWGKEDETVQCWLREHRGRSAGGFGLKKPRVTKNFKQNDVFLISAAKLNQTPLVSILRGSTSCSRLPQWVISGPLARGARLFFRELALKGFPASPASPIFPVRSARRQLLRAKFFSQS
jgi:hypothetical protein